MIKLRYAIFHNFRGMRDVRIDFSTSDEKPLTVVRAANYTGKTTLLYGLTWALFGDAGLPVAPRRRDAYRLHPIDWDVERDGSEVNIEAEVGLTVLDDATDVKTNYTLVRYGKETLDGNGWRPNETTYKLIRHDRQGDTAVNDPERIMDRVLLPAAKKDIFFVDGDARVNQYFADSDEDSRANVSEAVRHLLSLDIVESAYERMEDVLRAINGRIKSAAAGTQLEALAGDLEDARNKLAEAERQKSDAEADHRQSLLDVQKNQSLRDNALTAGGGEAEQLQKDLDAARARLKGAEGRIPDAMDKMRRFLNAHELYEQLAYSSLFAASGVYERLRRERKIPNLMPDMIRERLASGTCICGADLSKGTSGHAHLTQELDEVAKHSESRALLGRLANSANGALQGTASGIWTDGANASFDAWLEAGQTVEREEEEIDKLEHKVSLRASAREDLKIANANLALAKEAEQENLRLKNRANLDVDKYSADVKRLEEEVSSHTKKQTAFTKTRAEQQAARDVQAVLGQAVDVLLGETIDEVSSRMNQLFKKMIAAAPEDEGSGDNGVVQEVRLTRDCAIEAYGPGGRRLVPRTDLSAAQQQSLTVSLIMALIEVSGETSPTVIDTPLGRTSGPVRVEFLSETLELEKLRAREKGSKDVVPQKVLIMTPHEIEGVENMLDEAAGKVLTLSNSQHYPSQLVNDPGTPFKEILVCGCGPRMTDYCPICQRVEWS